MLVRQRSNRTDEAVTRALLDEAKISARIYDGDFRAPWLLSPSIYCTVWSLRKGGGETRQVDGKTVGDRKFDWGIRLPSGGTLTDDNHRNLLQAMQRLAFLVRTTPGGPSTLTTHLNFLWSLTFFARWALMREGSLDPKRFGFSRLTHDHFCDLIRDLSKGGVPFALECPQQFLRVIYPLAIGRDPSTTELEFPLNLNEDDCRKVLLWFERAGHLGKRDRLGTRQPTIRLRVVAELIGADIGSIAGNQKFAAFLTQFTLRPLALHEQALRAGTDNRREFASHRAKTGMEIAASAASTKTVDKYLTDLRTLVALSRHEPGSVPNPAEFRHKELSNLTVALCRPADATPWVPLPIALEYTKEALRWIHVYGKPLVEVFLTTYARLYRAGLLGPPPTGTPVEKAFSYKKTTKARDRVVAETDLPDVLKPLNITGWQCYVNFRGNVGFEKLKTSPSMIDAIMVLIASVAIITGAMKPMRESELRGLRRNCVSFRRGDGFWLSAKQRKRSIGDVTPELRRPIPSIAARGLLLLQKLTDGLKEIIGVQDQWLLQSLFALPTLSRYEARIDSVTSAMQLNQYLDTFCDRVSLPPDSLRRRWYIRTHELRKSFLIVFFWTYRYANLQSAAWMAGHTDVSQLYAYLQANFPGQELPALEAEYASRVLREHSDGVKSGELENVAKLHEAVCKHFDVRDLSWIDENTLQAWLTIRFESGDFEIQPYSVPNRDTQTEMRIAFRVRETC